MIHRRISRKLVVISTIFLTYTCSIILFRIVEGIVLNKELGLSNSSGYFILIFFFLFLFLALKSGYKFLFVSTPEQYSHTVKIQIRLSVIAIVLLTISTYTLSNLEDDYSKSTIRFFITANSVISIYFLFIILYFLRLKKISKKETTG